MEDSLVLMHSVRNKIREVALASNFEEVCGFVLKKGEDLFILEAYNEAADKEAHFQINPIQYLKAYKASDEIVAVYHSHPQGSADPSEFDVVMSEHCGLDFLIYSVEFDNFKLHKHND